MYVYTGYKYIFFTVIQTSQKKKRFKKNTILEKFSHVYKVTYTGFFVETLLAITCELEQQKGQMMVHNCNILQ